ncbi:MAG: ATP-binding protein, partial [Candidatus Bathyarchaeia archaeon]
TFAIVVGTVGFLSLTNLTEIQEAFDKVETETTPAVVALARIKSNLFLLLVETNEYITTQDPTQENKAGFEKAKEKLETAVLSYEKSEPALEREEQVELIKKDVARIIAATDYMIRLKEDGATQEALHEKFVILDIIIEAFSKQLEEEIAYDNEELEESAEGVRDKVQSAVSTTVLLASTTSILGIAVGILIFRYVSNQAAAERMAMSQVARSVGHDLRNPLTAIRSAVYILENEVGEERRPTLELINRNLLRADRMIMGLMDFSSENKLSLSEVDINSLIEEIHSQSMLPANLKYTADYGNIPKVKVDKERLKRVFANIFSNATEAMPEGGELSVSTHSSNNFIDIAVKDTGVGISKEYTAQLFTPFFTTKAKGMGLGLINAKRTIEAHGGSIRIGSQEYNGTIVTMKLPVCAKY